MSLLLQWFQKRLGECLRPILSRRPQTTVPTIGGSPRGGVHSPTEQPKETARPAHAPSRPGNGAEHRTARSLPLQGVLERTSRNPTSPRNKRMVFCMYLAVSSLFAYSSDLLHSSTAWHCCWKCSVRVFGMATRLLKRLVVGPCEPTFLWQ